MSKKTFRVATEGATCDGRTLDGAMIQQMADTYNPATYGARINLEHIRGYDPDGPFKAYGDVTALEARTVEDGKLALFATIDPTEELIALSKKRQKIYTSVEIQPKFADTGKAYLVGMAITDSPASLGCEMLKFCATQPVNPLASRKMEPTTLFTAAEEVTLEFSETPEIPSLLSWVTDLFSRKAQTDEKVSEDFRNAVTRVAQETSQNSTALKELQEGYSTLGKKLDDLIVALSRTPAPDPVRPSATGGDDTELAEF